MKRLLVLSACVFLAFGAFTACAQTAECVHYWDGGTVEKAATCGEAGLMKYTCTLCGEQKEEVIPKPEHPASSTYQHNDGEHWLVPSCEHTSERLQVEAHQWDGGTVVSAATCQTEGLIKYTCVCGYTKTEPTDKTDHVYGEWLSDDQGHWKVCQTEGCGETTEKVYHQWDGGVVTTAATCRTDGIKTFTCTDCNYTREETILKGEHVYEWQPVKGQNCHTHVCSVCGQKDPDATDGEHTYGDWERLPYSFSRVCTVCGDELDAEYFEAVTGGKTGSDVNTHTQKTVTAVKDNSAGIVYVVRTAGVYSLTFTAEGTVTVKLHYFEVDRAAGTSEEINISQELTAGTPFTVTCNLLDRDMVDIVIETDSATGVSCTLESDIHVHDFYGARWSNDATHHWHQCVAGGGCTQRDDYGEHIWGADGACTECGYNPNT